MKKCTKCKGIKPFSEFSNNSKTKDGYSCHCKKCHHEYCLKNRESNRERQRRYRSKNPDKAKENNKRYRENQKTKTTAQSKVNLSVRDGLIGRSEKCFWCRSESSTEGHHLSYNDPFDVVWLCKPCHRILHFSKQEDGIKMRSVIAIPDKTKAG